MQMYSEQPHISVRKARRLAQILLLFGVLALSLSISSLANATVQVVATVPDLGAIAQAVGGNLVDVTVLATPNEDPHFVDARPSHIIALNRADILLVLGAELEESWLNALQRQARNTTILETGSGYFDASNYVSLLEQGSGDRAGGDVHPSGNPHFNYSAPAMISVVNGIGELLANQDARNAATYRANTETLANELERFGQEQTARFATLSNSQRQIVPYHRSLTYLTQWLNLETVIEVEPLPGIPPNPSHVARVLSTMRSTNTSVIVQEAFYPTRTSETVAGMVNGTVVVLHAGTDISSGETYLEHITELCDALFVALSEQ